MYIIYIIGDWLERRVTKDPALHLRCWVPLCRGWPGTFTHTLYTIIILRGVDTEMILRGVDDEMILRGVDAEMILCGVDRNDTAWCRH